MVHITSVALFDAQREKEMVVLLLEYNENVKTFRNWNSGGENKKKELLWPGVEPGTIGSEGQNSVIMPLRWLNTKGYQMESHSRKNSPYDHPPLSDYLESTYVK